MPQLQSILINEYNFSPTDPSVTNNLVILRALKSAKTQTATRAKKISPNASGLPNLEKVSPYLHEESDAGATSTTVPKYIEIPRGEFAEMAKKALEDYATKNDGPSTFTPEEAHEILKKIGFDPNDSRMLTNNLRKLLGRTSLLAINPPQTSSSSSSTSQPHPSRIPQTEEANAGTSAASASPAQYPDTPENFYDTRDQILSLGKKKSSPLIRNIPLNQSDSPACKKASTLAQEEHFLANLDLDLDLDLIGNLLDEPIPGTLTHFPPPDLSGLENPLFPQLLYLPGIPLTAPSSSSVPSLELSTDVKKYFLVNLWDNEKDEPLVKLTLEKALKRLVNNGKINSTQAENTEFKKTLEDFMRDNQFL